MTPALEARTRRFIGALADGPTDAMNIEANRTRTGMEVMCDLPGPEVNNAQSVAAAHGFTLYGKIGDGRADGRNRYKFATHMKPSDSSGGLSFGENAGGQLSEQGAFNRGRF